MTVDTLQATRGEAATTTVLARWWAVIVFAVAGIVVTVHIPYDNTPPIRSDGLGYHLWTRALLDRDLSFCDHAARRDVVVARVLAPASVPGRCPNQYPFGLALLRLPVMAPFTAANHGAVRSDAEDVANQVLSLIAGIVAMATIVAAARLCGVPDLLANVAALAIGFGTGLFHSATYESSFTHAYNAALIGLLLLNGIVYVQRSRRGTLDHRRVVRTGVMVGVLSFFVVAIRQPLLLVLVGMTLTFVVSIRGTDSVRALVRRHRIVLGSVACGAAVALLVQLAYNRWAYGSFTLSSYSGEQRFSLTALHQLDVAFSFHKGLVTWYPIVLVAFVLVAMTRLWGALVLLGATTVPLVLLYGAWWSWDLAGGFGHRGFIDLAVPYGFGLALALGALPRAVLPVTFAVVAVCTVVTLGLMCAYWSGSIGFYGISAREWIRYGWGGDSFPVVVVRWLQSW